jgi:hypothetical protein
MVLPVSFTVLRFLGCFCFVLVLGLSGLSGLRLSNSFEIPRELEREGGCGSCADFFPRGVLESRGCFV